jgi:hypothetical protein
MSWRKKTNVKTVRVRRISSNKNSIIKSFCCDAISVLIISVAGEVCSDAHSWDVRYGARIAGIGHQNNGAKRARPRIVKITD